MPNWRSALARWGWLGRTPDAASPRSTTGGIAASPGAALVGGRYRLQREIGRGAIGTVHLAIDVHSGQSVAVKLMRAPTPAAGLQRDADDPSAREWSAARRLSHPGIVPLLDAGQDAGTLWTASEFVAGVALSRYTQPARLLPDALVLDIGAQLCSALAHAHAQGIVHRDLKPSNVLFDLSSTRARILDFGVARIDDGSDTRTGMTLGTPAYMAPEQLAGVPANAASDAYALGVMLFELFSGHRPHEAATLGELLRAVSTGQPAGLDQWRPQLDGAAIDLVQSLLHVEPRRRPADLGAFGTRLLALAGTARHAAGAQP